MRYSSRRTLSAETRSFSLDFSAEQIHGEVSDDQPGRLGYATGSPDQSLDSRKQFGEREGLCKVVVTPV